MPRSGKTYEVTSVVIYNALKIGRRVVSNIAGLNEAAYHDLLTQEGVNPESLGSIVKIEHDDVLKPDFWLNETDFKAGKETFIQSGDLLVLDEIWRFWDGFNGKDSSGNKMPIQVLNFFRMHGHFAHPKTGFTCEMAFITQDVTDCGRKLRVVIDETFRTTKLTAIGSSSSYRIDVFTRSAVHKKPLRQLYGKYDSKFFTLYKSNSMAVEGAADAREESIDKRSNILSGYAFKLGIPIMLLVLFLAYKGISRAFNGAEKNEPIPITANNESVAPSTQTLSPVTTQAAPQSSKTIVGFYEVSNVIFLVIRDGEQIAHTNQYESLSIAGLSIQAVINGETINNNQTIKTGNNRNAILN